MVSLEHDELRLQPHLPGANELSKHLTVKKGWWRGSFFCRVGDVQSEDLGCLAVDAYLVFAAVGKEVHAFSRGRKVSSGALKNSF